MATKREMIVMAESGVYAILPAFVNDYETACELAEDWSKFNGKPSFVSYKHDTGQFVATSFIPGWASVEACDQLNPDGTKGPVDF